MAIATTLTSAPIAADEDICRCISSQHWQDDRVLKRAHDPDLDVFDKGVAVLLQNDQVLGHVATELTTMWSPSRPLTVQD